MVVNLLWLRLLYSQRNLPRGEGGWTGNALFPLILLSERQDDSYLVVGISPLTAQSGGQEVLQDQRVSAAPLHCTLKYVI